MFKVLSNSQMRAADEYTVKEKGISTKTLMRRAGLAVADEISKLDGAMDKSILVVCGNGNNGGDGLVMSAPRS